MMNKTQMILIETIGAFSAAYFLVIVVKLLESSDVALVPSIDDWSATFGVGDMRALIGAPTTPVITAMWEVPKP